LEKRKQSLDTEHEGSSALKLFCVHRLNSALEEFIRKDKSKIMLTNIFDNYIINPIDENSKT